MSNPISFSTLTSLTCLTDFNKKCCSKIVYWPGFVLFLYSLVERTRGSLVRASTSGLCRKERHKFEPRSTREFLSVPSRLSCTVLRSLSYLLARFHSQFDLRRTGKKESHLSKKRNQNNKIQL